MDDVGRNETPDDWGEEDTIELTEEEAGELAEILRDEEALIRRCHESIRDKSS